MDYLEIVLRLFPGRGISGIGFYLFGGVGYNNIFS
jgi:hypothetical protein